MTKFTNITPIIISICKLGYKTTAYDNQNNLAIVLTTLVLNNIINLQIKIRFWVISLWHDQ